VELVNVEEEVDRRVLPPDPSLAVLLECSSVGIGYLHHVRHGSEHLSGPLRVDEDVDIQIACAARLFSAIGKRNRPSKRMRELGMGERVVDLEQTLTQQAHCANRLSGG
jgi:hypothetical protein